MRTARRVISCLLILIAGGLLPAQQTDPRAKGSVDADVTITGSDDSVIPVPEPLLQGDGLTLPPLDTDLPQSFTVPPLVPPPGAMLPPPDSVLPPADAGAVPRQGPDAR